MLKVGDQITIGNQLVEVTYVMNEKAFGYKPVEKKAPVKAEPITEETEEVKETPKRTRRKKV